MVSKKRKGKRSNEYVVRRVLADGTTRSYTYNRKPRKPIGITYDADSIARVIEQWQRSADWSQLSEGTKKNYKRALTWLDYWRSKSIKDLRRSSILEMRDIIASERGMGAAHTFQKTMSCLMTFALNREFIEYHPLYKVKNVKLGQWLAWTEDQIQFALKSFPSQLRRAIILALYTGQRSGDVCRMQWSHYNGSMITVKQQKTGEDLEVPIHSDLKAELDTWPREAITILTNAHGQPWRHHSFVHLMHKQIGKHEELAGLQFHGLRKVAASRLADAGCTTHEIMAVTGHRTLAMVQLYTEAAEKRRNARAAVIKWEGAKQRKMGLSD